VVQGERDEVCERLIDDDQDSRRADELVLLYIPSLRRDEAP
jgi:hypothetical protein